jgi:hypothetical protein
MPIKFSWIQLSHAGPEMSTAKCRVTSSSFAIAVFCESEIAQICVLAKTRSQQWRK